MKTVQEAAERLKVSKGRVIFFIRSKRLIASQLASCQYVIKPAELARFARIPRRPGKPKKVLAKPS